MLQRPDVPGYWGFAKFLLPVRAVNEATNGGYNTWLQD